MFASSRLSGKLKAPTLIAPLEPLSPEPALSSESPPQAARPRENTTAAEINPITRRVLRIVTSVRLLCPAGARRRRRVSGGESSPLGGGFERWEPSGGH